MGKINVKIFSLKEGYKAINGLKAIKVVSKDYNILIMEDYLSVVGEIQGDISLIGEDEEIPFKNVRGFYRHSHNEFELLLKEND